VAKGVVVMAVINLGFDVIQYDPTERRVKKNLGISS